MQTFFKQETIMKNILNTLLLLCVSVSVVFTQTRNVELEVKSTVDLLINLCEEEKYDSIAALIVYSGKDQTRYLKDTYNYSDRKEVSAIKRIGKKIKAYIDLSDSRKFGRYSKSVENKIQNYSLELIFKNGEQEIVTVFTFTEVNDKLLLLTVQ